MDSGERQKYITAIKTLAAEINLTEIDAQRILRGVEQRHLELEAAERDAEAQKLEAEIGALS
jgi:DNA gyrase/topoisomerase IV subunit A